QAKGPIANPVEMANTHEAAVGTLKAIPGYHPLFSTAFPDAEDPITIENAARAIAAFEATLTTPDAPFDRWLAGDDAALSPEQKRGLRLFLDNGCTACHNGPLLGGNSYQKFGVVELPDERILPRADKGRMALTGDKADEYVFKVPSLRNIALTRPYFHSGAVWELSDAVKVMAASQLGNALSDEDAKAIATFLESLTGRQPQVAYPVLPASGDWTPRPDPAP
ncbi:MAG: cytochrome C peroxidase, partial [Alphaproteobacteria bacterium]